MKKFGLILLAIACLFVFTACSTATSKQKGMYEDNALVAEAGDSYSFADRIGGINEAKMDLQFSKFYGSQTIWTINVTAKGDLKIDFDTKVDSGKFKGVLIKPDGTVTNVFEGTAKNSFTASLAEGKYRVKIVGNNAKGKANVELKLDKAMTTTVSNK